MTINRPKMHRRIAVMAAGLLAVAAVALGITRVASSADAAKTEQARLWKWAARIPGVRTGDVPLATEAARAAGLDPATVSSVVARGAGRGEARLVSASSHAGGVCFAVTALGEASSFSCRRPGAQEAALIRVVYGGSSVDSVDHVTVVGVGRGDVGSISVTTTDGTVRALVLNRWRGFGYAAVDPGSLPTALSVYGKNGSLLQRVDLGSFAAPG
jgi:hypothetical protein